jgi:hypothetical protein
LGAGAISTTFWWRPLHRAVALVQVHGVAVGVGQDLHLDVLGPLDVLLQEDLAAPEGGGGLALGLHQELAQLELVLADAHPAPAAAERGLEDDRVADALGLAAAVLASGRRLVGAGNHGQSSRLGLLAGGGLVAHQLQQLRGRTDEHDARFLAGSGELGVLGQEAVAGVDGVGAVALGDADDARDVQVRP